MPNMKNAKKKVKSNIKKTVINNEYEASMKNAIKNVEKDVINNDKEKAQADLKIAIKKIDKAHKVDVIKDKSCARKKSRLTKKVNTME